MIPHITFPTTFEEKSATLIDEIFTEVTNNFQKSILYSKLSDHCAPFIAINTQYKNIPNPKYVTVYFGMKISIKFVSILNGS